MAILASLMLPGCSSVGDFGRLPPDFVWDGTHDWVGSSAAARAGAPAAFEYLTDNERALRDLAFPLIEPPYDRQRWDSVLSEYGIKHKILREFWTDDVTAYYQRLQDTRYRSTAARYNKLIDDIRNDVVRIRPFFDLAHRVVDLDQRREQSMRQIADLSPQDRFNALARIGENSLTIAWVQHSLTQRCAAYRFALEHLVVAEPERIAAQADVTLRQLQQVIAANQLVPPPRLAAAAFAVAALAMPTAR